MKRKLVVKLITKNNECYLSIFKMDEVPTGYTQKSDTIQE